MPTSIRVSTGTTSPGLGSRFAPFLSFVLCVFWIVPTLFCQTPTATITGSLTDQSGAVIPNGVLVARNLATRVSRTVKSTSTGDYVISNLLPGIYELRASKEGFKNVVVVSVPLDVNQAVTLDIRLTLGSVSESVEVTAESTLLQTTDAGLGTVITEEKIRDLPLNARNFTQLLALTPGATPVSVAQNSGGGAAQRIGTFVFPSINGQSNRSNSFTLDGVYNNGNWQGTYAIAPSVDALAQFKVQSHSDEAEVGGVTGGVVNLVSKSGTNQFHGTLYEFLRNDALDAKAFFAAAKPVLRQNQFGATIGGPVVKDRTFFFFSYEGYRQVNPAFSLYIVPTPEQLSGDFSASSRRIFNPFTTRRDPDNPQRFLRDPFEGNRIPASMINKATQVWGQALIPKPIDTGNPGFNGRNTTPQSAPANQYNVRVDHSLSASDSIWARYTWGLQRQRSAINPDGAYRTIRRPAKNLGVNYTHAFSSATLLSGLFGFTSMAENTIPFLTGRDLRAEGGFSSFPEGEAFRVPAITLPNTFGGIGAGTALVGPQAGYQGRVDLSHHLASHSLKIGGEVLSIRMARQDAGGGLTFDQRQTADLNNPVQTGSDIASFVLGTIEAYGITESQYRIQNEIWNAYVQDAWKVNSRLTLNFGLRWDFATAPRFTKSFPGTWDFNTGKYLAGIAQPPACSATQSAPCLPNPADPFVAQHVVFTGDSRLRKESYKMFGPRFSLAYRLNPSTVIRSSFGIFYDLQAGTTQQASNTPGNWPDTQEVRGVSLNQTTIDVLASSFIPPGTNPRVPALNPAVVTGFMFDPNFEYPYSQQWNLEVQRALPHDHYLKVAYVGSHTSRLPVGGDYNTALTPGPGAVEPRRLWPHAPVTDYDRSIGRSNYHGLQVKAEKRFSTGVSYLVSYTWSKSIDVASSGQFGVEGQSLQNPYDPNSSRSVSGFDVPHHFTTALVYQLPFGAGRRWVTQGLASRILGSWQMNAIVQLRSGQPYTLIMNVDVANIGARRPWSRARPNLVGNPRLSNPTPLAWFDKSAYATPALFTFGTAGRNQLRTDGFQNFDLSLFRDYRLSERLRMQFRVEMFNAFNHPTFGTPQTNFTNPVFGRISSTVSTARQIQLGLKVIF